MIPISKTSTEKTPDIASLSIPDTLLALKVNAEIGLSNIEVDSRRKEHGFNEVIEQKGHPVLKFLGKFWGISAWMLELIMILSIFLQEIHRCRSGWRIIDRKRYFEFCTGAASFWRCRGIKATLAGKCSCLA